MILTGLVTLGHDAELNKTASGTSLLGFSGAYNTGFGDNKKTHWLKLVLFGKQAESVASHFLKGTKLNITARDIEVEPWQSRNGETRFSLKGIVIDFDFAGSGSPQNNGQQNQAQPQQNQPMPQQQNAPQPQNNNAPQFDPQTGQPLNPQQMQNNIQGRPHPAGQQFNNQNGGR